MEGKCPVKDANIAAPSSKPFIQIDSISIDLISSDDKIDCGKCEHFSIRQFVSETRKKDWKVCWPFALDGDRECEDQTPLLPPLEIPNFSWWRCPNCQQEMSSKDFHHIPKLGTMEKIEISNTTNFTDNCNPSSGTGQKGAGVVCSIRGKVIGSEDGVNLELHKLSISAPNMKSSVVLQCINESVTPKPEINGFRELHHTDHGSCQVEALELSMLNLKGNSETHCENLQNGKQISLDDDCRVFIQASDIGGVLHKDHNVVAVRDQSKSNSCTEVERRTLSESEFGEISTGNGVQDSHVHKPNSSLRRKTRKHRLLTELLGENRSMKNKQVEVAVDSLSNGTSVGSTGQHNKGLGESRKRKMHKDEEWRPREITPCNKNKYAMPLKEDVRANNSITSSRFENPSQTGMQMTKSLLDRKKYKKVKAFNAGLPVSQIGEDCQQKIQDKRVFSLKSAKMKSKSSMSEKTGKMEVKEAMETSFVLDKYLLSLGPTSRKDVETMGNLPMSSPFHRGKEIEYNRLLDSTSQFISHPAFVTHMMPFPIERQRLTPQFEDRDCFHSQEMGTEVQEGIIKKKGQNCKRVDQVYEKGPADDIPMEIVELMAKFQFEREIEYAENRKRLSEAMGITKNAPKAYNGNSHEQESKTRKPFAENRINGVITAREAIEPNKRNLVDYLSHISGCQFSTNHHLLQMQSSKGYGAVLQTREKPYGEIQYSAAGSSKTGNAQKEKQAGSGEERARSCSQMMLDQLPFGYNLPQNCSFESINADKTSNGHISRDRGDLSAQPIMKFLNENSNNTKKKNSVYGLQELPYSYQSSTDEKIQKSAMKSLDLCSNEAIPAMHLLTLMDAGMQSTPPFTPAKMQRFPKKPAFLSNLKPNEFIGFDVVSNNKIDPVRSPSSRCYSGAHPLDCFPACSTLDASTSSQQGNRDSNFAGQFASKLQKKEKGKRSKKCVVTNDGKAIDNNGGLAVHNGQHSFFNPAESNLLRKNSFTRRIFEDSSLNAMLTTPKRPVESFICTINKNPSDFSLPEAGNIYTIGAEDLKFGRKISSSNQFGSTNGLKRKSNKKHSTAKESTGQPISS